MPLDILGQARPNTFVFESSALIKATDFRDYNARRWFGHPDREKKPELNLVGVHAMGMELRTLIGRIGEVSYTSTGHYFRSRHQGARCQTRRCHSWLRQVGAFLPQAADRARLGRRLSTAIAVCEMPDCSLGKTLADLYRDLPRTFSIRTMSPHCPDEVKYGVVAIVAEEFTQDGIEFAGQAPANLVPVNGGVSLPRRHVASGQGLVEQAGNCRRGRPVSPERRREMFGALDAVRRRNQRSELTTRHFERTGPCGGGS